LRVRIARGRSYASILIIPRRKTSLCEALHGEAAMAGFEAPLITAWQARGRGREGRGREHGWWCRLGRGRAAGGAPWGWPLGAAGCPMRALCTWLAVVHEEGRRRRKEKREKKRKRRKRKEKKGKNMENFLNLKISEK
jgi:hypothetical protein